MSFAASCFRSYANWFAHGSHYIRYHIEGQSVRDRLNGIRPTWLTRWVLMEGFSPPFIFIPIRNDCEHEPLDALLHQAEHEVDPILFSARP